MKQPFLTIVRGITGSGKTTFVKSIPFECLHLEADMFCIKGEEYAWKPESVPFNHDACKQIAEIVMSRGADIVISNTFTRVWEMEPYLKLAKDYGHKVGVIRMQGEFESTHSVPPEAVQRMKARFEDYEGEILVPVQK